MKNLFVDQWLEAKFLMCNPISKSGTKRRGSSHPSLAESHAWMFQDVWVEQSSFTMHLCKRNSPALLFALKKRWLEIGLWLQCGYTGCLSGEEEVNFQGNLGREQVSKSVFPGSMAAQVRLFCRTKSKLVWETRIFRNYSLAVMCILCNRV